MELVGGIGGSGGTDNIIVVMKSYTLQLLLLLTL